MTIEYLIPITLALVEVIKKTGFINDKFMPLVSLILGMLLGYTLGFRDVNILLVGLGASGLYDVVKPPLVAFKNKIG